MLTIAELEDFFDTKIVEFLQDKENYPEEELLVNPPKEIIQESNAIKCDILAILSEESVRNEIE